MDAIIIIIILMIIMIIMIIIIIIIIIIIRGLDSAIVVYSRGEKVSHSPFWLLSDVYCKSLFSRPKSCTMNAKQKLNDSFGGCWLLIILQVAVKIYGLSGVSLKNRGNENSKSTTSLLMLSQEAVTVASILLWCMWHGLL